MVLLSDGPIDVIGIDFDKSAIFWANRNYKAPNLQFKLGDIRQDIPVGPFENIVWDAAIEHFTENEIQALMKTIKSRLVLEGILSGYTITEKSSTQKHI
jgi:cyclopropane fatty-acyl-phospholipid synthase-like methyltransferase